MGLTEVDLEILSGSVLFEGFSKEEITGFITSCGYYVRRYAQGQTVIDQGDSVTEIAIVLSGRLLGSIISSDGNVTHVNIMKAGQAFGDVLSGSSSRSPVTVSCDERSEILWLPMERLLAAGSGDGVVRMRFLRNLIREISDKYFALVKRNRMLSERSIRNRLLHYLSEAAGDSGEGQPFKVPHRTRADKADHLACDRTALCRELGKMRRERIIDLPAGNSAYWIWGSSGRYSL